MDWHLPLLRVALGLYGLGFLLSFAPILGRAGAGRFAPILTFAGWLAHGAALLSQGFALGRCPLDSVGEILSVTAWCTVLAYLCAYAVYRIEVLHLVIPPLVLIVLFAADRFSGQMIPVSATLRPSLLRVHLTVIIFAVAALSITFTASVAYVLLDRALKRKRPGWFVFKLPSLERCDRIGRLSLLWAFPLMTLGIVTGAMYSASVENTYWAWQPRETLAVISWAILAVVVVARLGWGWRGRSAALLTMLAFSAVLVRMLGMV